MAVGSVLTLNFPDDFIPTESLINLKSDHLSEQLIDQYLFSNLATPNEKVAIITNNNAKL